MGISAAGEMDSELEAVLRRMLADVAPGAKVVGVHVLRRGCPCCRRWRKRLGVCLALAAVAGLGAGYLLGDYFGFKAGVRAVTPPGAMVVLGSVKGHS